MIKNLLQEAFALKEKKHYKHSIEIFYKALELDNESSELLLEIAELYYLLSNEERALSYIQQILDSDPMHIPTLKLLKQIFESKNALQEAEQTAKNIYCISKQIDDLVEIFKLLNKQGKFEEIFEYEIPTYNADICLELANAKYYLHRYDEALKILNDSIEQGEENQTILTLYAKILYTCNKKEECVRVCEKIILNNNNPELMSFLAQVELYKGNLDKAIEFLNIAIKKNNSCDEYYFNLGNIYYKKGDNILAKKNYNIAISLNPENKNYHFALANLYYSEKHYKKALEELKGNFFEAKLLKSVILYDTGYLALAKKELDKLQKEQPNNVIVQDYKNRIDKELSIS